MRRLFKHKKTLIAASSLIAVFLMCFLLTSRMYADTIPNVNGSVDGTDLLYEFTGSDRTLRIYVDTAGTTNNTTVSTNIWQDVITGGNCVDEQYVETIVFDNTSGKLKIAPYSLFYEQVNNHYINYFNECTCIDLTDTPLVPTTNYSIYSNGLFYGLSNLTEIKVSGDKSLRNIGVDAGGMFAYTSMSNYDDILKEFDFSNCEHISNMFVHCHNISTIDLDNMNLDRTNTYDLTGTFMDCEQLVNVDFGDTPWTCLKLFRTFQQSSMLEEIDLSKVSDITTLDHAFYNASMLKMVYFGTNDYSCKNFNNAFENTSIENFNFNKRPDTGEANAIKLSTTNAALNLGSAFLSCESLKSVSFNGLNNTYSIDMSDMLKNCENVEFLDLTGVNFPSGSNLRFMTGSSGVDIIMLPDSVADSSGNKKWIGYGYYPVKMTGLEPSPSDTYSSNKSDVVVTLQAKGTYDYYKKGPSLSDMITAHSDKDLYDDGEEAKVSFSSEYPCIDLENETWSVVCYQKFNSYMMAYEQPLVRLYEKDSDDDHYTFGWDFNDGEFVINQMFMLHVPKGKIRIDLHYDWIDATYLFIDMDDPSYTMGDFVQSTGYIELDAPKEGNYGFQLALMTNENMSNLTPLELQDIQNDPYKYLYFEIPKSILSYIDDDYPGEFGTFNQTEGIFTFNPFDKDSLEGDYLFLFVYDEESDNYYEDPVLLSPLTLEWAKKDILVVVKNPEGGITEKSKETINKSENTFTTKLTPNDGYTKANIDVYKKDKTIKEFDKVPAKCVTDFDVSGGKDFTANYIDGDYKFVVTFIGGSAPGPSPNPPGGGGGGGSSSGGSSVSSPKVTFNLLSSNSKENESLLKSNEKELKKITFDGNKIKTLPSDLNRDGFIFDGWYKDKEFKEEVKLGDSLQGNVTLYAKWKEIENFTPYIKGYDDGEFKPNRYLSRAEVATIISRLSDEFDEDKNLGNDSFPDTKKNFWYSNYIKFASDNKFFEGYPDGEFKPDRTITRGELVKVLVSFSKIKLSDDEKKNLKTFSDISDVDFFKDMANMLLTKGLIKGYEDGSFKGNSPVTRAEACSMINSILESTGKTSNVSDKTLNFTDVKKTDWFYTDILKSVISN